MIDQNALTGDYISRKRAIAEFQTYGSVFVYDYSGCAAIISRLKVVPADDVRPVVTCAKCRFWTAQENSLQGRCELSGIYPTGGYFCANGRKKEDEIVELV